MCDCECDDRCGCGARVFHKICVKKHALFKKDVSVYGTLSASRICLSDRGNDGRRWCTVEGQKPPATNHLLWRYGGEPRAQLSPVGSLRVAELELSDRGDDNRRWTLKENPSGNQMLLFHYGGALQARLIPGDAGVPSRGTFEAAALQLADQSGNGQRWLLQEDASTNDLLLTYAAQERARLTSTGQLIEATETIEAVGGAGATSPSGQTTTTFIKTSGAGTAQGVLPAGTHVGQVLRLVATDLGVPYALSTNGSVRKGNGNVAQTLLFNNTGNTITLEWNGCGQWFTLANVGVDMQE